MAGSSSLVWVLVLLACHAVPGDLGPLEAGQLVQPLEQFGLLENMALLDRHLDPEAQLWNSLLDPLLVPRYVGTPAHETVREHIVNVLSALGWTVDGNTTFHMTTPLGKMPFTNIIATLDPAAPRRLVLACHYDSIYGRDRFVAATDSAVPCAMMLYLATLMTKRYLDKLESRSQLTLQLLFLDGEEAFVKWTDRDSVYGARHLANQMEKTVRRSGRGGGGAAESDLERIDCFVLLDLLGAANPSIPNYMPDTNKQFRHLVSVEQKLLQRRLLTENTTSSIFHYHDSWRYGAPRVSDDHLPFMHRGVKILHLIPHPFPEVWHKDADDGASVHFPTVTNINRILRVFVSEHLGLAAYL